MRTRALRRVVAIGALVLAFLAVLGPAASASPPATQTADTKACQYPEKTDEQIHIKGCLRDTRDDPPSPVPGVTVTVTDASGTLIQELETDETGVFDVPLPGEPILNLNKDFIVKIDESTLPEGADLRNPEQVELTINFNTTSDQTVVFPIGDKIEKPSKFIEGVQLAIGGLVFSALLAMSALGLSMIFGTTGLTNFAHGELVTFGALMAWAIDRLPGEIEIGGTDITVIVGVLFAFVIGGFFGLLNDKALWKPLRDRGTGIIAMMIVSIGLSIFLRSVFQYFAGGTSHNYSQYSSVSPWHIGQIAITSKEIAVFSFAMLVLVAVSLLVQYTRLGKATRAVADNPALAASSGINVQRVIAAVWIVGAALAALAGALLGLTQGFDFQIGFKILLLIFAAVVLGGLGTIWGAMVGAFVIGLFVEVSTLWVPAELKYVGALLVLILVLLVRPQGILGRAQRIG